MTWRAAGLCGLVLASALAGCIGSGATSKSSGRSAAEINAELGLAYMQQGDYEHALEKLKHALSFDPQLASGNHYIAEVYQQIGENKSAEMHYRKALSITPVDPMLLNNFGVFLCRQKRLDEAQTLFMTAAKQPFYKTPEVAYSNAALCALQQPDEAKAEEYLRAALRLNPKLPAALYEMAALKFKQQEYLNARAFLQRYFNAARASPQSLWLGVRVEKQLGDETNAAKYATRLKEDFPLAAETELLQGQTGR